MNKIPFPLSLLILTTPSFLPPFYKDLLNQRRLMSRPTKVYIIRLITRVDRRLPLENSKTKMFIYETVIHSNSLNGSNGRLSSSQSYV